MKKIIIDLKELVTSPCGTKDKIDINAEISSPAKEIIGIKSPLSGILKVTNLGKEILAEFNFKIKVAFTCFRCGEKFSKVINLKNKKTYKFSELTGDQKLDILPQINEEVILSIPAKPLCKENCKGRCPICGQNLNIKKCGCRVKTRADDINKPFANLKRLLERKKNG